MQKLAPIALFVYNRDQHLVSTIASLLQNTLASRSELIIFADGARHAHDEESVHRVRKICRSITGFKSIDIIESNDNRGLARSIKSGVTEVLDAYGKVIVIEDDLLTSPQFLTFVNNGLDQFQHQETVMQVSGFKEPVKMSHDKNFFFHLPTTWGWGTWKHAWAHYNDDASDLLAQLKLRQLLEAFDLARTNVFLSQLSLNAAGVMNTWGIKWAASIMLRSGCVLYPRTSLVKNIGFDNSGCNCTPNMSYISQDLTDEALDIMPTDVLSSDLEYGLLVRTMLLNHLYGNNGTKAAILSNTKHYVYKYPTLTRIIKGLSWK